jgi:hypothetical protein
MPAHAGAGNGEEMLDFEFRVSEDRETASVAFALDGKSASALTPQDIETLIDKLSDVRQMMAPGVHQSESLLSRDIPVVESFSPQTKVAQASLSVGELVLLEIAFHGLGRRCIALRLPEAQALGRRLMALSAQGPQNSRHWQ